MNRATLRALAIGTGWCALLLLTLVALAGSSAGGPHTPPLLHPGEFGAWTETRDAPTVVFAIARLLLGLVATYLLAASILALLARLTARPLMEQVARTATIPPLRRLFSSALGLGLTASASAIVLLPSLRSAPPTPVGATELNPVETPDHPGVATMRVVQDDGDPVADTSPNPEPALAPPSDGDDKTEAAPTIPPPHTTVGEGPDSDAAPKVWTAQSGDHLWRTAETVLGEHWERAPEEGEVASYWEALISLNRERLADPTNPDLIFAGQEFELPPVPPAPVDEP